MDAPARDVLEDDAWVDFALHKIPDHQGFIREERENDAYADLAHANATAALRRMQNAGSARIAANDCLSWE